MCSVACMFCSCIQVPYRGLLIMQVERAKVLSNTVKQKRKEKAGKWEVPLPKVLQTICSGDWHGQMPHAPFGTICLLLYCQLLAAPYSDNRGVVRCGQLQRMRCLGYSNLASERRKAGSAWLQKSHLWVRASPESPQSMKDSSDHQVGRLSLVTSV